MLSIWNEYHHNICFHQIVVVNHYKCIRFIWQSFKVVIVFIFLEIIRNFRHPTFNKHYNNIMYFNYRCFSSHTYRICIYSINDYLSNITQALHWIQYASSSSSSKIEFRFILKLFIAKTSQLNNNRVGCKYMTIIRRSAEHSSQKKYYARFARSGGLDKKREYWKWIMVKDVNQSNVRCFFGWD